MRARLLPWDYGVRNLLRNPWRTVLGMAGVALVALLAIAATAFVRGMGRGLAETAVERNVIVLGAGSEESVERSEIRAGVAGILAASVPGIEQRLGTAYVSPEVNVATLVRVDGEEVQVTFRGVTPTAYLVHPQLRIVEGRAPGPGELLVGEMAAARMGLPPERLRVGSTVELDGHDWTVAGRFRAPGTVMESEIWCDLQEFMVATRRNTISAVVLTMAEDGDASDVDLFTKQRLDLELVSMREQEYYDKLHAFYGPVRAMVWVTAGLVAAGAFLGGLNTLYASFAARIRELATLQAIGFGRPALVLGLVQESALLAAGGALAGAALSLPLDGLAIRISMGAFGLEVDAPALVAGLGSGVLLGAIGALPAAWRCLRMPVVEALRAA